MWDKMVYKVIYIHCMKMSLIGLLYENRLVVVNIYMSTGVSHFSMGSNTPIVNWWIWNNTIYWCGCWSNKLGSILKVRRGEECQVYVIEKWAMLHYPTIFVIYFTWMITLLSHFNFLTSIMLTKQQHFSRRIRCTTIRYLPTFHGQLCWNSIFTIVAFILSYDLRFN